MVGGSGSEDADNLLKEPTEPEPRLYKEVVYIIKSTMVKDTCASVDRLDFEKVRDRINGRGDVSKDPTSKKDDLVVPVIFIDDDRNEWVTELNKRNNR